MTATTILPFIIGAGASKGLEIDLTSAHTRGMSEDRKFCPNCKAMTMEPAEGSLLTQEELDQVDPALRVFEGRLVPYQCPVCLHFAHVPVF
jgi:hypothetical protein